jgi:hypothetical protein
MEKSGLPGLLEDAVISPTTECIKEVIREWAHGTRLSRTDWDFQKLWDAAKEAIESAYSAGLVIAGIRLISGLICAGNREPEYYVNIEYAKQVYAEYGDSRWKGVANLVWRFSSLKDANSELIWAQCLARKDHKEMDVARIALLRGLLAQAAGVWSEADKLFESFVLVAKETIKDLETAQLRNEEDRIRLEKKYIINPSGKIIIEKLIADPRAVDAVAKGSIEALVKSVSPRTERGTRGFIGEIVENRVGRTEIENRIQGLNRFIA